MKNSPASYTAAHLALLARQHARSDAFRASNQAALAARVAPEPLTDNARRWWIGKHIAAAEAEMAQKGREVIG